MAFLQEMFDPECIKDRRTPREPESFSHKQPDPVHAQKARAKHPPPQAGQDPLGHTRKFYIFLDCYCGHLGAQDQTIA